MQENTPRDVTNRLAGPLFQNSKIRFSPDGFGGFAYIMHSYMGVWRPANPVIDVAVSQTFSLVQSEAQIHFLWE